MLTRRQTKRLATIFICAVVATSFQSFQPNGRFSRSLSEDEAADVATSTSTEAKSDSALKTIADVIDDGCWRKCPQGRINRIYYNANPGRGAGLNDRKFVMRDLAELAGYLCAQLVIPKPYELLNEGHNNGKHLSHDFEWKDLWNAKFAEDDKPIIVENQDNVNGGYEGYLRVISRGAQWKADFEKIHEHSWAQEHAWRQGNHDAPGFVWELLDTSPYFNDLTPNELPMLKPDLQEKIGHHYNPEVMKPQLRLGHGDGWKPLGCQYSQDMKDEVPEKVIMMRKRLTQRIQEITPNATFGALHLRRGDAINECDTSIERVKKYLACSLKNTEELGHLTILLMSDEQDKEYRRAILDLGNDYSHVTILDLDKMNIEMIEEAVESGELDASIQNNYFEYDIELTMKFTFYLERRRREHCYDCAPLKNWLTKTK